MGKTATNLVIVLGLITVAFAGYYMYTQQATNGIGFNANDETLQNMLTRTSAFTAYRQELDAVQMDMSLFEDERFRSLREFSTPIQEQPIGRPNPFADTADSVSTQVSTDS